MVVSCYHRSCLQTPIIPSTLACAWLTKISILSLRAFKPKSPSGPADELGNWHTPPEALCMPILSWKAFCECPDGTQEKGVSHQHQSKVQLRQRAQLNQSHKPSLPPPSEKERGGNRPFLVLKILKLVCHHHLLSFSRSQMCFWASSNDWVPLVELG